VYNNNKLALPREIGEHIFATETVYPGLLRYKSAVLAEYVFPGVEQHVSFDVDDGQVSVGFVNDRFQIVKPRGQERFERPVKPRSLRLAITRIVHTLNSVHVTRVWLVQRCYS